jgi:hypothetical protein
MYTSLKLGAAVMVTLIVDVQVVLADIVPQASASLVESLNFILVILAIFSLAVIVPDPEPHCVVSVANDSEE